MKRHSFAAGFTLVEVLVVVLIASIVMVVLASVLGSSFEVLRTGETRAQLNSNARIALEYVADDISSATAIPLSFDRDLNGYPDEDPTFGYDEQAYWRVAAWDSNNVPVINTSYWFSEAWADRIMLSHDSTVAVSGQNVTNRSFAIPKILRTRPDRKVVEYNSLIRLAIPASNDMPYYLASEWDRDGDGDIDLTDLRNSGTANPMAALDGMGEIQGYPELVPVGPYKETAALIQDLFGYARDQDDAVYRVRQIPVASNITRLKFEYLHEVPVYHSRLNGLNVEIACQDLTDGTIDFIPANSSLQANMSDMVPLISHWELRPIDVAFNRDYTDSGGGLGSGDTGMNYGGIHWQLKDQYPEGMNYNKLDGTHVTPNTISGLGDDVPGGWSMSDFYTSEEDGENAPIDRLCYVTTGVSGGQPVDGGIAEMRPDMEAIHGSSYYQYSISPTGRGDLGDADGIPDGDGIPDDPIPGWWLPYIRAVRLTIIATPRQVYEERRARSGQEGQSGQTLYYRLDSPVPYADPNRLAPLYNLQQDYIGAGRDVVVTKTVPVEFIYKTELVTDPFSAEPNFLRRVEYNYFRGIMAMYRDPLDPDENIRARSAVEKLFEKDSAP